MARELVNKATSTSNDPTPGYLYNEIARTTLSGYNENRQVVNALVVRLKSRNHNVKWKALQVIKHVALQGLSTFKRDILRELSQQGLIQDCLQFTGPPDPLRGEEIYRRVQVAARETMEVLNSSDVAPQVSYTLEGLGGQHAAMATEPTTRLGQIRERFGGAAAAAGSMKNKAMHGLGKIGGRNGYNDFTEPTQSSYPPASSCAGLPAQADPKPQEKRSTVRMVTKNVRNLAFMRSSQLKENLGSNEDHACSFEPPKFQDVATSKPDIEVSRGGEYEGHLVRELCTPGGMRATPPKDALESFLRKVPSLDVELIGWSIIDQIATTEVWQVRSKALAVVSSLLQTNKAEAYGTFFAANSEEIEVLVGQKPASVSGKARSILDQIGVHTEAADCNVCISGAQEDPRAGTVEGCSGGEVDLLGDFFSGPAVSSPAAPESIATTTAQPAGSLFAGLVMSPSAPPAQPVLAEDPFAHNMTSSLLPEYLSQPTPFDSVNLLQPTAPMPPLCDKPDSKDPTTSLLFSATQTQELVTDNADNSASGFKFMSSSDDAETKMREDGMKAVAA